MNPIAKAVLYKLLFTEQQVASEIKLQGLTSIKGDIGAFLLYQHIATCYNKGEKYMLARIFKDCGFSLEKYKINEISVGEFYLRRKILIQHIFTGEISYEIVLNTTISSIKR